MTNLALCRFASKHVKGRLCLCSFEALRVAFILAAAQWVAVNKAQSVLQAWTLYQATSQCRVSSQRSWLEKGVSTFPLQTQMVNEFTGQPRNLPAWHVTA